MRKILAAALFLLSLAIPASAQWTNTFQTFNGVSNGGSIGTFVIPAGAQIVATANYFSGSFSTLTGLSTVGFTCSVPFAPFSVLSFGTSNRSEIWGASGCSAASAGSVTAAISGGGVMVVGLHILTGLGSPLLASGTPQTATGTSGTTQTGPSYTPPTNGEFIISILDPQHSCVSGSGAGAGWSVNNPGSDTVCDGWVTSNSVTAGTPEAPSWTLNAGGTYSAITMGFKPNPANLRGPKGKIL